MLLKRKREYLEEKEIDNKTYTHAQDRSKQIDAKERRRRERREIDDGWLDRNRARQ